ncbi:MAG: hypothetical protein II007_09410 [Gammaproteobacteria bacterium]|nr:hypothetical protein [Gammaproteobacteria bacterium]
MRLAYNWLDFVIGWKLDDYFELDRRQKKALNKELEPLLAWHRQQELPGYARLLRNLSADLAGPLTTTQVTHYLDDWEAATRRLAERLQYPANRVAALLSDQQVTAFMAERRHKQAERRKDWQEGGLAKVQRDAMRKLERDIDRWFGSMEPAQRQLVTEWARWQQQYYPLWLDYQEQWLDTLEQTLAQRGSRQFGPAMIDVVINSGRVGGGRFSRHVADSRQQWITWAARLSATLTPEQRQRIRSQLDELAGDLEALSGEQSAVVAVIPQIAVRL